MWFGRRKTPAPSDPGAQLRAVPIRNPAAEMREEGGDGVLLVTIPMPSRGWSDWLARRLGQTADRRSFQLEDLGRWVFESIDGRKTIEDLLGELAARHRLTFFEARALLTHYLRLLAGRGLIVVAVKQIGQTKRPAE